MRASANITVSLALLALGSPAIAGPKPPTTANFQPEIIYSYASGNYTDLRLANRAGDQAILVHRSTTGLGLFDASIEGPNRIAYREGLGLFVRTWSSNPVTVSAPQPIYSGPGSPEGVDFSPDGGELAFATLGTNSQIFIYNFAQGELTSVLNSYSVILVRWDPVDRVLYFSGSPKLSGSPYSLRKLDLRLADLPETPEDERVTALFPASGGLVDFDVSRAPVTNAETRLLVHVQSEIGLWRTDGSFDRKVADGSNAHFNCRNDAIIHRAFATRRPPTRITHLSGGFETWSTDSNISRTDWIPRVPC